MRILKHENHIDLESPIFMNSKQIEIFKNGMKDIFGDDVLFTDVKEPKLKGVTTHIRYTKDQLPLISNLDINVEDVSKQIGKSEHAINLKRGRLLKKLLEKAKKENESFSSDKNIKEFVEDELRKN